MCHAQVLYLPSENITHIEVAAKDKDRVQRLESTVIHWTRQIKEVVNNQDNNATQNVETAGPLEEIQVGLRTGCKMPCREI